LLLLLLLLLLLGAASRSLANCRRSASAKATVGPTSAWKFLLLIAGRLPLLLLTLLLVMLLLAMGGASMLSRSLLSNTGCAVPVL
jgi:hypothetical protein